MLLSKNNRPVVLPQMSNNENTVRKKGDPENDASSGLPRRFRRFYLAMSGIDWRIVSALALFVFLGAYLRIYFDFSQAIASGYPGLSGGSDADYYFRVLRYALVTGHQLELDPLLNYPLGARNPFLPFYVWTTVLAAWIISFLFHLPLISSIYSSHLSAGVAAYVMMSAFSGIISIIVAYYIGKELFDKHTGLLAAGLMAFMPSIVSESTVGFGVHDPFILMMAGIFFFFYFRSLNTVSGTRWVERWNRKQSFWPDFASISAGIVSYVSTNRKSLIYAFMAGIVLASIANAWEGYSYLLVIVSIFYLVQSFIYKFRNRDTLALTATWVVVGASLLVFSLPIYLLGQHLYPWYVVAVAFFFGTLVLGIVYTVARDVPWLSLLTALIIAVVAVVAGAEILDKPLVHTLVGDILLAQSYFIKTTVYTTIAEALAPPFSLLALSLGGSIFFIAFAELVYIFYLSRRKISDSMMLFVVWSIIAVFMAVSTVRFILDATTVFVVLGGKGLVSLIRWADFGEVKKGYQTYGFSTSGTRKSVKLKHVIVLFLVVSIVILPLVWSGIDAGTPETMKQQLNTEVYNIVPGFLRPTGYTNNGSSVYYFGAFGYSLSTLNNYFPAAWEWLYQHNENITPPSQRPAYLSWWDYGSAAITKAGLPAVADDFQQGYHFASAVLFSQNETQLIALLSARVIYGYYTQFGYLPQNITSVLDSYGLNSSFILSVYRNPAQFTSTVLENPQIYGPFASNAASQNIMWAVLMATISKIGLNNTVTLYQQLSGITHYYIGYFSVDTRLFPFSATDTGVFYAPALLGGRPIAGPTVYNIPYDYYTINATSTTGVSYPLQSIPPNTQIVNYSINYQPMFYNMTLYRFFMGYSAYDLTHQNLQGLPALSGSFLSIPALQNLQPLPGWMMSHFFMAYRTAYYNPYPIQYVKDHPNAWQAIDVATALKLYKQDPNNQNYTIDLSPQSDYGNGIVIMQYYPGAYINGTVLFRNGQPASGVRVTVLDQWGIPHDIVYTNSRGQYSLIAPPGNDTVVFSTGPLNSPQSVVAGIGQVVGEQTYNVSNSEAMRYNVINTTTGLPAFNILASPMKLNATSVTGYVFFDNSRSGTYVPGQSPLLSNVTVRIVNTTTGQSYNTSAADGHYEFSSVLPGEYQFYLVKGSSVIQTQNISTISYSTNTTQNIPVYPGTVTGQVMLPGGSPLAGANVTMAGVHNGVYFTVTSMSNGSFSFQQVIPGNYTLTLSGGSVSAVYSAFVRSFNTTTVNIIAQAPSHISGTAFAAGTSAPYATIYFYSNEPGMKPYVIRADAAGYYSANIGAGNYTVYSIYYLNSAKYVLMESLQMLPGAHSLVNFTFSHAVELSGTVYMADGVPASFAGIYLQNGSASLTVYSDSKGNYSALLPAGTYSVWISTKIGSVLSQVSLYGSGIAMDFTLQNSRLYTGAVSFNGGGSTQYIAGAHFTMDYNGIGYSYYSGILGNYSFYLPVGFSFRLNLSAFGMQPVNYTLLPSTPISNGISMTPVSVTVAGHVEASQSLPAGSEITFTSVSNSSISRSFPILQGSYSAALSPGSYKVGITNYSTSTLEFTVSGASTLNVGVGSGKTTFNVALNTLYNLTVDFAYPSGSGISSSQALTRLDLFSASLPQPIAVNGYSSGRALYVPSGVYTIYAYSAVSGSIFAYLFRFNVSSAMSLSIQMSYAYNLSGSASYGGSTLSSSETVTVTMLSTGASVNAAVQSNGTFSVSLPPSNYSVNVTYPTTMLVNGTTVYVVYYGNRTISLNSPVFTSIDTLRLDDNATISGTVSWYYGSAATASISFTAINGNGQNQTTMTSSQGGYRVSLQPGRYLVSAVSGSPLGSDYTAVSVTAGQSTELNLTLAASYNITGPVTVAGIVNANPVIVFSTGELSISVHSFHGSYSVILPPGNYTVTSNYSFSSQGTVYRYVYEGNVTVSSSLYTPVALNIQPFHSLKLKLLSVSGSSDSTGFTLVRLQLENEGDVPTSFAMRIASSGWAGAFTPIAGTLGTGNNSTVIVTASIYPLNGVGGGNATVYLQAYATATGTASTVSAQISVPSIYTFYSKFDFYQYEQQGRVFAVNLLVFNTGNTVANFTASISNLAELNQEGWKGGISTAISGPFNSGSVTFSVPAGQNQSITISLTANSSATPVMVPISFTVTNTNTNKSASMAVPISLPAPVVMLNGIKVSGHGASPTPLPLFTERRGVIIFLLAAFVIFDVYLAKKKRLIR
jgi:asparagine N-glycosylation enzyme membrane subunit Stt3